LTDGDRPWHGAAVPVAVRSFDRAWWLPTAHTQTVVARLLRPRGIVALTRERWATPDGDFLDLDFVRADHTGDGRLVVVLHGLEGSARSGYAFQLYSRLAAAGVPAVGLNFRSCSGEPNRGARLYHSGETSDLAWVIARLGERHPRLAAVGVSLGGNVLLKYLGERGGDSGLEAAAALSVPFDLSAGADFMESGFARVYVRNLLAKLKRKLHVRRADLAHLVDLPGALAARTFRSFDDAATAPLHGFADAEDYYRQSSCASVLHAIRTPTMVVHARDDPFLPAAAIPEQRLEENPAIEALLFAHGGHVGFVAGAIPLRPCFWAERTIARWLEERLA
jgi:predicted alpha/beta-fold hydrolase